MKPVETPPLVVHVIYRLAVGGLENGLVNLINQLSPRHFRHAIVCLTEATDFARRIRRPDVPIIEMHKAPGNSLMLHRSFYRIFRKLRPAIVHTRNLGALEAQFAAAAARVPLRLHGEHGWDVTDPDGTSRRYATVRRLYSPLVHRYVALSGHIERYLHTQVGIGWERIERICNGVDCERFRPQASLRAQFPYLPFRDPSLIVVGSIGRLEPVKDPLTLARAFILARQRHADAVRGLRLAIVGAGSLRPAIEETLTSGGASEFVWLPGERSDVPELLPAFDIFALPSLAEGISNTVLEAMACGAPVVATAVGGNEELVSAGVTGELVPPGNPAALADAIARLARDRALRTRMGAAARTRAVVQFSLDEMVRRYALLYGGGLEQRIRKRVVHSVPPPRTTSE